MSKIDFQWDMTEENFRAMMKEECREDLFGSVRFGKMIVEFRCNGNGEDPDECQPVADLLLMGEHEEAKQYGYVAWCELTHMDLYCISLPIPRRRCFDRFKREFEQMIDRVFTAYGELRKFCECETLERSAWY